LLDNFGENSFPLCSLAVCIRYLVGYFLLAVYSRLGYFRLALRQRGIILSFGREFYYLCFGYLFVGDFRLFVVLRFCL